MTLMSNWHLNDERRLFSCLSFLRGINFAAFNLKLSSLLLHSSLLCQLTLTDIFKIRLPFILFYEQLWHECILLKKHLLTIQESVVGRIPEIRWGLTWTCGWFWMKTRMKNCHGHREVLKPKSKTQTWRLKHSDSQIERTKRVSMNPWHCSTSTSTSCDDDDISLLILLSCLD